jgi:serine/threonine protein kinase
MTRFADRYVVVGEPFQGGMGAVFPCEDSILERKVALKLMKDTAENRRIVDEIAALLKLRSKHVVQVYDILQIDSDTIAVVQEFVEGTDLFDAATVAPDAASLYKQLWQVASGIADIHASGLIHRDIKPNNMKLDGEGIVKIFDFGLARDQQTGASTMGFVGTRWFAAPELYGTNVHFTSAVDVYAFGVSAIFLATRNLPPAIGLQPPGPLPAGLLATQAPTLTADVVAAIESCLKSQPEQRPSMAEIRDLLATHLLFDRHQALVVYQGQASYLNSRNRRVTARLDGMGVVTIAYDGLRFIVEAVQGDVFINYGQASVGQPLPGSCVVALGSPEYASRRRFVTFDLSSPEVVL